MLTSKLILTDDLIIPVIKYFTSVKPWDSRRTRGMAQAEITKLWKTKGLELLMMSKLNFMWKTGGTFNNTKI